MRSLAAFSFRQTVLIRAWPSAEGHHTHGSAIVTNNSCSRSSARCCRTSAPPASDPESYGETAYVDADLLALLNRAHQLGRYVAQAKLADDPAVTALLHDRSALDARLRRRDRDEAVVDAARQAASGCDLGPGGG